ncbi:MAG: metallophosphoesterase family protein [Candidatus Micrarchaeia archaeon]
MAILIVSDLHYERGAYKGVDESYAFKNFLKLVLRTKAENVIVLGDIGHAWTLGDFERLAATGAKFHFIYGNHDPVELLKQAKNKDGSSMLMKDGEVVKIGTFAFAFINGVAGNTKLEKGMELKEVADFEKIAEKIRSQNCDNLVLCTHPGPRTTSLIAMTPRSQSFSFTIDAASEAVTRAVEILTPFISLSGHVKFTGLGTYTSNSNTTIVVKVQTSTLEGTYALIDETANKLEIGSLYNNLLFTNKPHALSLSLSKLKEAARSGIEISDILVTNIQEKLPLSNQNNVVSNRSKTNNEPEKKGSKSKGSEKKVEENIFNAQQQEDIVRKDDNNKTNPLLSLFRKEDSRTKKNKVI